MLSFFKGVRCSAKNLLKIQAFILIAVTKLSFTKRGEISGFFSHKMFSVLTNRFLLIIKDYLTFTKVFIVQSFSGIN